jgi:diaminopimelate decarboxylase
VEHFPDLTLIDLGSGFKVPFKKDEKGTDMLQLGTMLGEAFEQFEAKTGRKLKIWFEPGKFLVSECGYLLVKANVVKQTPSKVFVGVNSGFNHLIRPMFYDAYHFIENISHPNGPLHEYTVVGNICETGTFAHDRMLPAVTAGDVLAFYNAGAYGFEMSSNFNARLKPAEVLVLNNNMHLIRKPDTFDNLLINQVEINVL